MYTLQVSTRKNKKYDVYKDSKYLLSFGDKRYGQYQDSTPLKHYAYLDNNDKKKRENFRKRFQHHDINNPNKPIYFSWRFLWT